jgi:hypothetical protein
LAVVPEWDRVSALSFRSRRSEVIRNLSSKRRLDPCLPPNTCPT